MSSVVVEVLIGLAANYTLSFLSSNVRYHVTEQGGGI